MKFADLLEQEPSFNVEKLEPIKPEPPKEEVQPIIKKEKVEPVDVDREVYLEFNKQMLGILADVNKIMLLASKRKIGVNLVKALWDLSGKVLAYRKFLSNKNIVTQGGTAQRIMRNQRKFQQLVVSQFIPFISIDKLMNAEFVNQFNKKPEFLAQASFSKFQLKLTVASL